MASAAAEVFAERGFAAASMEEIAARAGVTKPMLYAYFDSKEGLFAACAVAAGARLRQRVRTAATRPGLGLDDRLWAGFQEVFAFVDENRDAWQLLYPAGSLASGSLAAGGAQAREDMAELLLELLRTAAAEEGISEQALAQLETMAHAVTGATLAAASWWLEHPDEPRDLAALRLMNLVWMGFGEMVRGRAWLPGTGAT